MLRKSPTLLYQKKPQDLEEFCFFFTSFSLDKQKHLDTEQTNLSRKNLSLSKNNNKRSITKQLNKMSSNIVKGSFNLHKNTTNQIMYAQEFSIKKEKKKQKVINAFNQKLNAGFEENHFLSQQIKDSIKFDKFCDKLEKPKVIFSNMMKDIPKRIFQIEISKNEIDSLRTTVQLSNPKRILTETLGKNVKLVQSRFGLSEQSQSDSYSMIQQRFNLSDQNKQQK